MKAVVIPMLKHVELGKATGSLARYARRVRREPLVITKNGKPVAALVPVNGMDLESLSVSTHPDFISLIEESRARHNAEGGISHEDLCREFGIKEKAKAVPINGKRRRKARTH